MKTGGSLPLLKCHPFCRFPSRGEEVCNKNGNDKKSFLSFIPFRRIGSFQAISVDKQRPREEDLPGFVSFTFIFYSGVGFGFLVPILIGKLAAGLCCV